MPKLEYFLAAQSIADDKSTNLVSLFHVLEAFSFQDFPATVPDFVAVSCWLLDEDDQAKDFQVTLRVSYANEETVPIVPDSKINFTADGRGQRIYHFVQGLQLEHAGALKLILLLDGVPEAEHVLNVGLKREGD